MGFLKLKGIQVVWMCSSSRWCHDCWRETCVISLTWQCHLHISIQNIPIISFILHEWRIKDVICKGDTESWLRECIYDTQTCSLRWLTKGILVHQTCICYYVCMCTSWREILCAGKQENILGKKIQEILFIHAFRIFEYLPTVDREDRKDVIFLFL